MITSKIAFRDYAGSHFDISISRSINIRKRKICLNQGYISKIISRGVARIFQRGGHTV